MEKFEALIKPVIKVKYIWFENIVLFVDDSKETKMACKMLIQFLEKICVNVLPKIILVSALPNYPKTPYIQNLINTEGDKLLEEMKSNLESHFENIIVIIDKVATNIEGLKKLKDDYDPDLAIVSSPYDRSAEILEVISQFPWIQWIEKFKVPTVIVPYKEEDNVDISRMFRSITVLANDWTLADEKINSALLFLYGDPESHIEIISVVDTEVIKELQEKTEMQELQEILVDAHKKRQEIFVPQLKQGLKSVIDETEKIPTIHNSVLEGESLKVLSEVISNSESGMIIIGQRNKFSYSGKLASHLLQNLRSVPILLLKDKKSVFRKKLQNSEEKN